MRKGCKILNQTICLVLVSILGRFVEAERDKIAHLIMIILTTGGRLVRFSISTFMRGVKDAT
jgi:hypothetical protein